jgi:beta-xylosidase
MVGFPQYTYPAALPMLRVAIKLGAFPMPGVGAVPPEGMEGLKAELATAHADVEQYTRKEYGAVSLVDAVRNLLPNSEVTAVAGTGVLPWGVLTFGLGSLYQHGNRLWFRHD